MVQEYARGLKYSLRVHSLGCLRCGYSVTQTVLQPAFQQAQYAVELADKLVREGSTGVKEKLLMDCVLITRGNAQRLETFNLQPL